MVGANDMNLFSLFRKALYKLVNVINVFLGQVFFVNAAGLFQNLIGKVNLMIGRFKYHKQTVDKLGNSYSKALINDGYLLLDDIAPKDKVFDVKEKFSQWCKENSSLESQYRLQASSADPSVNFLNNFPEVKELISNKLESILAEYYSSDFEIINIHIYRTRKPENVKDEDSGAAYGGTLCWHSDGSITDTLKVFFLLSDVEETDGPMLLFDKLSSKKLFRKYLPYNLFRHGNPANPVFKNLSAKYTGKIGRCLIVDTNRCLHRASVPSIKPRDMITFYIGVKLANTENKFTNIHRTGEGYLGRYF